jgi:1-phosphatidylinositol-4-phosphate 5-kinase
MEIIEFNDAIYRGETGAI